MSIYARQTGISIQLVLQRSAKGMSHPHSEEFPQQRRRVVPPSGCVQFNSESSGTVWYQRLGNKLTAPPRVFIGAEDVQKKNWMNPSHKIS